MVARHKLQTLRQGANLAFFIKYKKKLHILRIILLLYLFVL